MRCVVFDLDDTLYDAREAYPASMSAAAALAHERYGIPEDEFLEAAQSEYRWQCSLHPDSPSNHSRAPRFQRILEARGKPPCGAFALTRRYWEAYLDAMRPRPEAAPLLQALRAAGLRVGVGTNMLCAIQLAKLERLGLDELFDFVATSDEAAAEKPAPEFFALVVEKARCAPGDILFCGDNLEWDARGAARAGMRGVWLRTSPDLPAATDVETIDSLAAIEALAMANKIG